MNYTYDLGELGRQYRRYLDLMAHWRRVLPEGRLLEVRDESMVVDLEGETRRILDIARVPESRAASPFTRRRARCERRASTRSAGKSSAPPSIAGAATGATSDR